MVAVKRTEKVDGMVALAMKIGRWMAQFRLRDYPRW
jgi:hypothetical protein